nr:unnamed protein product [Callosobruchus analis]
MISYYRIAARSKKWTLRTIFHLFGLEIAILYRDDRQKLGNSDVIKLLEFKIGISENATLFTMSTSSPRPSTYSLIAKKRIAQHLPAMASDLKNSDRCKNQGCKQKTKVFCESCNVFLCLTANNNCSKEYHLR